MNKLNKIAIIGTSGCGKTTLGRQIAKQMVHPCVDLDDLYWLPNWQKRDEQEFVALMENVLQAETWVVCGNYSGTQKLIFSRADTIIWLDIPLPRLLWRVLKRGFIRSFKHESCCNGNFEDLARLFGRESILLWVWKTYARRKKAYEALFANNPDGKHLIRLKNNADIREFLSQLYTSFHV